MSKSQYDPFLSGVLIGVLVVNVIEAIIINNSTCPKELQVHLFRWSFFLPFGLIWAYRIISWNIFSRKEGTP